MKQRLIITAIFLVSTATAASYAENKEKIKTAIDVVEQDSKSEQKIDQNQELNTGAENTLKACQDAKDNDKDGHTDCEDQDCEIFAVCVNRAPKGPQTQATAPVKARVAKKQPKVETGWRYCRDGIDNDNDGLIDCHEQNCQETWYCKRRIYETPEPEDKEPGFFVSTGIGLALPNFRNPTAKANTASYKDVPFDPDAGAMAALSIGYFPKKWFGFGVNLQGGATAATNREVFINTYDDEDKYKYWGIKGFGQIGGFARFQWPFRRFVPYLDIALGYTGGRYYWKIYPGSASWDDIDGDDHGGYYDYDDEGHRVYVENEKPKSEKKRETFSHMTFALAPGFDYYLRSRSIAIGLKAWLPIVATSESSTDNIGVMLSFTYTPLWREKDRIKPEYDHL